MAYTEARVGVPAIIAEALERWGRCDDAESEQRERIVAAKKFRAGDQWDPAIKAAREGKQGLQGQAPQPPRPCLTIDRISQPVRQISNQIKSANFAIDVMPQSAGADQDTADIFKGYLRRIQNQARGESPIEWAADQAIEGGIGWFRLRTEYVQDAPDPEQADISIYDQELRMERIANNLTVYCDPTASKPTRSDASFMFVTEDLSKDEFKRKWPKAKLASLEEFAATGDTMGWVTKDDIRIAEYWRCTYREELWAALPDGSVRRVEDAEDAKSAEAITTRVVRRPKIEGFKINACEVLEEMEWVGTHIPLIPVLGEELNIDGKAVLRGLISEGMDAQRMVNYTYSGAVENFALANKAPFIAAAGQIDPYIGIWQTANTYNYSYLPYEPISLNGTTLPPPQRQQAEPPIQAAVELMRISEEGIKATTGIFDAALGRDNPRDRSGRAIQALQGQSDLSTSNYGDGVTRALIYAGEQIIEVLPKITRPGQILHVLGLDDAPEQVMVGQHFVTEQNGVPKAVDPKLQTAQAGMAQFYDLKRGRYAVTVKIGKASATKREEGAAALGELIPHLPPEMAAVATPDFVEQLDFQGSHQIAEKLRKTLPPGLQGDEEQDAANVAQLQSQLQQMQMALEQLKPLADKNHADLMKVDLQKKADLVEAQMHEQGETERLRMKLAADIEKARIAAAKQSADLAAEAQEERLALGVNITHEQTQNQLDREHERHMAQVQHEQALEQGEQGQAHALEQGEQQAALTPPTEGDA